jgi:nicotinamidase-related amidase
MAREAIRPAIIPRIRKAPKMSKTAVLLMDLQKDFLDHDHGRMPVDRTGAAAVVSVANAVLSGVALPGAQVVRVLNQFPRSQRIGNWVRRGAALAGSEGAGPDPRLVEAAAAKVITKSRPSAFSNPELEPFLRSQGVDELVVIGVFAEGCVRSTVRDALRRGWRVTVVEGAVASDAAWKKRFALWSMRRAGARIVPDMGAVSGRS